MITILNDGPDSFGRDLVQVFESFQAERVRLLGTVREMQLGAQLLATFEGQRLARKSGDGDPRVAALGTRAATILERVGALDVEIEVASIRVPSVSGAETLIHGRVTDEQRIAAGGATAVLVDERRQPVEGVEPVEIDDAGYYAFVVKPDVVEKIGTDHKLSVQVERDDVHILPATASPFTIGPGTVAVNDVALSVSEMDRLKLRPSFVVPRNVQVRRSDATRGRSATGAKASPVTKKRPRRSK